jgi:hypothetical protein
MEWRIPAAAGSLALLTVLQHSRAPVLQLGVEVATARIAKARVERTLNCMAEVFKSTERQLQVFE